MGLSALVDEFLPGPGGLLDEVSLAVQERVAALADTGVGRPVHALLHGNEWFGHPLHAVVVLLPVGSWSATGWYDLRAALTGDPAHDAVADATLRLGIVGALGAAATGTAQYLDTRGSVRRETSVHAVLNNVALGLYVGSWAARKRGRRRLGRLLATGGLGVVMTSGYLGGDISYRHGVGVRPQALRDPGTPAQDTPTRPLEATEALHY